MKRIIIGIIVLLLISCSGTLSPVASVQSSSSVVTSSSSSSSSSSFTTTYVPPVVTTSSPVYASVFYTATSNKSYGMFAISYKVTNNSSVPIRISNILYTIYGSAGGALNDIVLSTNSYQSAWIPVGSYATGELDGNSVSYIPYSFSFSVYAQGSDGGSNSGTYTGIFNVIAKRTMVLDSIGIPMNRE